MDFENLAFGQVVMRGPKECNKVEVLRCEWQHFSEIGRRLREQHMIALEADLAIVCRTFAEHELAETWSAEAEKHAQAKGAMLLQEWMQPSEEELIC